MDIPLLTTKFSVTPLRPGGMARPSLLRKLDVHSRMQVVIRARELGLLPAEK